MEGRDYADDVNRITINTENAEDLSTKVKVRVK